MRRFASQRQKRLCGVYRYAVILYMRRFASQRQNLLTLLLT